MASAYYDSQVQRMQSYVVPPSGSVLGSCGQYPTTSRITSTYQLPSTGQQLSSYTPAPTVLNAGSSLLPSAGSQISSLPSAGSQISSYYQLPSTGNIGSANFSSYISSEILPPKIISASASQYTVNQEVEIYSESSRGWVSGVITKMGDNGMATVQYNGNQKLVPVEHQQTHLRPATRGSQPRTAALGNPGQPAANFFGATPKFDFFASPGDRPQAGTEVEYYSTTHCAWVQARIMRVRPNGNYDLDVKADVPPEKTRPVDPMQQGGVCENLPPKRVAPSYDDFAPPPPNQVGTFQFDLAALCGNPMQQGAANNAPPLYNNYAEPQNYGEPPNTCFENGMNYNDQPSFLIDLAQACKDVEQGDQYGNGPRRVETEYLAW